jgi:carbamoylphosphate synthase large subunit
MEKPQDKKDDVVRPSHSLVIAAQAKPFPYAAVATALMVNGLVDAKQPPIDITKETVALFDPTEHTSTVKLIRKKE